MKKLIFTAIIMFSVLIIGTNAQSAQPGDVIGNVYSTDILAFINGVPVQSYNIGGRTMVIIEDLTEETTGFWGINYNYIDDLRLLVADFHAFLINDMRRIEPIERGEPGNVLGNIYETDIVVYVNGLRIPAFSLNGRMAVAIEDLGATEHGAEWSRYLMRYIWNEDERTISLEYLHLGLQNEVFRLLEERFLSVWIENDVVSILINYFSYGVFVNATRFYADFSEKDYFPLWYGNIRIGTGFISRPLIVIRNDDGGVILDGDSVFFRHQFDIDTLVNAIKSIEVPPPTFEFEEMLHHFIAGAFGKRWEIYERIDTDEYTNLHITMDALEEIYVRFYRDGTWKQIEEW